LKKEEKVKVVLLVKEKREANIISEIKACLFIYNLVRENPGRISEKTVNNSKTIAGLFFLASNGHLILDHKLLRLACAFETETKCKSLSYKSCI
jgi:hypothetical protein